MSELPERIKSFLTRSQNVKEPDPPITKYGFKKLRFLRHPLEDKPANNCVVLAHHDLHGEILALLWFTHVLDRREYQRAMAKKYEVSALSGELLTDEKGSISDSEAECHLFIFYEKLHPNFVAGNHQQDAEQHPEVHLVPYQDDDSVFVNRRVVLDENVASLGVILDGLGIPYLNIDRRHKGASDEAILTMGIRGQEHDVLITRDKEFATTARNFGVEVIELTTEETTLDEPQKIFKIAEKLRERLEQARFHPKPMSLLVMSDKEILSFLEPLDDVLLQGWKQFLASGNLLLTSIIGPLSNKKRAIIDALQEEKALSVSLTAPHQYFLTINVTHPSWLRYLKLRAESLPVEEPAPIFELFQLLASRKNELDLSEHLKQGLINLKDGKRLLLTQKGQSYLALYHAYIAARVEYAGKDDSLETETLREDNLLEKDKESVKKKRSPRITRRDRRRLLGSILRVKKSTMRKWISIPELESRWQKLHPSLEVFYIVLDSLVQDGILTMNEENEVTIDKKAYSSDEFADLVLFHEIALRHPIHYLDLRKIFVDKGCSPLLFDVMLEKLRNSDEIKDQKGYLSINPKPSKKRNLAKKGFDPYLRAYQYVVSDQFQRRTVDQIVSYLERKAKITSEEASKILAELLEKQVLITTQDERGNIVITRGPRGREFLQNRR